MTTIDYEYSLFITDDGEVATGVATGENTFHASSFLAEVLMDNLDVLLEKNPNRIISFVIHTFDKTAREEQ